MILSAKKKKKEYLSAVLPLKWVVYRLSSSLVLGCVKKSRCPSWTLITQEVYPGKCWQLFPVKSVNAGVACKTYPVKYLVECSYSDVSKCNYYPHCKFHGIGSWCKELFAGLTCVFIESQHHLDGKQDLPAHQPVLPHPLTEPCPLVPRFLLPVRKQSNISDGF